MHRPGTPVGGRTNSRAHGSRWCRGKVATSSSSCGRGSCRTRRPTHSAELPIAEDRPLSRIVRALTGDEVREVRFREKLRGYRPSDVDELLSAIADAVDAGRSPRPLVAKAQFRTALRGYH